MYEAVPKHGNVGRRGHDASEPPHQEEAARRQNVRRYAGVEQRLLLDVLVMRHGALAVVQIAVIGVEVGGRRGDGGRGQGARRDDGRRNRRRLFGRIRPRRHRPSSGRCRR